MELKKDNVFITVKDHSVSGEVFELLHDKELDLLYTTPKPEGDELSKYYESDDYISHTDGRRSIFEKAYQFVKKIALKNKLKLLNNLKPAKGELLDIGAGTGDFLSTAAASGWNGTAIEPSAKARDIAERKGLKFAEATRDLPAKSFDVITMWHVLEHVPYLDYQIAELKRLLKSDGLIVIAVPNFKSYDAKIYGEFWAAFDAPRHLWHFSRVAIERLFSKHDLGLLKVLPMPFDAFYVSLLSEKYKNGSMNPFAAFANGLKSNIEAKKTKEFSSHIYIIKNKPAK